MSDLRVFWWSPAHSPRLLRPELLDRSSRRAWASLLFRTGRVSNFGDRLSGLVAGAVTGNSVVWAPPNRADVIGIGSIVEVGTYWPTSAVVWGTGLRRDVSVSRAQEICSHYGSRFAAVRGVNTRQALGLSDNLPIGDPGLLAPLLVDAVAPHKRHGSALITHYRAWSSKAVVERLQSLSRSGFTVVPPSLPARSVVSKIASAEIVYSSSLHGLIVAHAMGVPAVYLKENTGETDFKYRDYVSALGSDLVAMPAELVHDDAARMLYVDEAVGTAESLEKRAVVLADSLADSLLRALR